MSKREALPERIAQTIREFERSDAERRRRKSSFEGVLARLEERFMARRSELEHVRGRLTALTDANQGISSCIERLAATAERAATADREGAAALTLRLRTEMLPGGGRYEDVTPHELAAEERSLEPETADSPAAADDLSIPRFARR